MYDILQLNDMLVPELLDIAEQQDISNAKKLEKQELIYQILDKQTSMSTEKKETDIEKRKRKRITKTTEDIAPETEGTETVQKEIKPKKADDKKKPVKKNKEEDIVEKEKKSIVERVSRCDQELRRSHRVARSTSLRLSRYAKC